MKARCFDCDRWFMPFKNDRLCPECERLEWERQKAKGAAPKSRKTRSRTGRVDPETPGSHPPQSFAMRLHGRKPKGV